MGVPSSKKASLAPFDGRIPAPQLVSIATTLYCNLKCRMCEPFLSGTTTAGPHMEAELFERIAEQVFPFVSRFQPSVSGEPTMSRGFMDMVRSAASYGVKLEITTNGTLLSSPRLKELVPTLGVAVISFDGATAETFESIRVGARYERVLRNVRHLVAMCRALPADRRPRVTFNSVIMERNARELPALVRLAHEVGVDEVFFSHVYPESEEFKRESLVHSPELGRRTIAEAVAEARRLGQSLNVAPLDQLTAATALGVGGGRQVASADGVVEGFERIVVNPLGAAGALQHSPDVDAGPEVRERRREGRKGLWFVSREVPKDVARPSESIWICDYLWHRLYVGVKGLVSSCCVPGAPVVDSMSEGASFDVVWNNRILRAMRQRLAVKQPAPVCRGCKHIREIRDPAEVQRLLGGRRLPDPEDLEELPETLREENVGGPIDGARLVRDLAQDSALPWGDAWPEERELEVQRLPSTGPPPRLAWKGRRGWRYRVEVSTDGFGEEVHAITVGDHLMPELTLAEELWAQVPAGRYDWRVWRLHHGERVVWRGVIVKEDPRTAGPAG